MTPSNPTDGAGPLAAALFDDVIVRLSSERRVAVARPYFPEAPAAQENTYFEPASPQRMDESAFQLPGDGDSARMLEQLSRHWDAEGDAALLAIVPRLRAIAKLLGEQGASHDGHVDIFCYTLF